MVDGIAVFIYFVLGASDALGDDLLCFVSDEAIDNRIRVRDEIETANLELVDAISSSS